MAPPTLAVILFAAGVVLLLLELFLPTHGLLGVVGVGFLVGCVAVCFGINQYLGLGVLLAMAIASPFGAALAMRVWPKTPLGRKVVLQPVESRLQAPPVRIGDQGTAITELRPMGLCEINQLRIEVRSELGIISTGSRIQVVNVDGGRPIVRPVSSEV